ncbi:MAG: hypothetical protein JXJ17_16835 [Anaerolineae bacterium]|nr:hypothetical protein [Anaerolineae bacterium]
MKLNKWWPAVALVLLSLFLTGCITMDMTLSLGSDENWDVVTDIIIDEDMLAMAEEMGEEMDFSDLEADMDTTVGDIQDEYASQGISASWEPLPAEGEDIGYRMTVSGQGYDVLEEAMFEGGASFTTGTEGGKDVVYAEIGTSPFGEDMGDMEGMDEMGAMMDIEFRFTIEGKEILETNGTLSDDGTSVTWVNTPAPYTATVVTGGGFPTWGWIAIALVCLLLVVVVIAAVVVIVVLSKKKKKEQETEAPAE